METINNRGNHSRGGPPHQSRNFLRAFFGLLDRGRSRSTVGLDPLLTAAACTTKRPPLPTPSASAEQLPPMACTSDPVESDLPPRPPPLPPQQVPLPRSPAQQEKDNSLAFSRARRAQAPPRAPALPRPNVGGAGARGGACSSPCFFRNATNVLHRSRILLSSRNIAPETDGLCIAPETSFILLSFSLNTLISASYFL